MVCRQCGTLNDNETKECKRCKTRLKAEEVDGKLTCDTHPNRVSTSSCLTCGKRLCELCLVTSGGLDYCAQDAPVSVDAHALEAKYEALPVLDPVKVGRAGFGRRLFAVIIDGILWLVSTGVVVLIIWLLSGGKLEFLQSFNQQPVSAAFLYAYMILSLPIYLILNTATTGQTIGKRLAGVIILQPDGKILSLQAALIRTLASVLSLLPLGLGLLWTIWDKNHETWHDKIAKTAAFNWGEDI